MTTFPIKDKINVRQEIAVMIALLLIGAIAAFPKSYVSASNFIIGSILLPFAFFVQGGRKTNYSYLLITLLFGALSIRYQLKIFYFITITFSILFIVELWLGKVNTLVLFLIGVMSPVFLQVAVILGFPIRLQLSEWAGGLMSAAGLDIQVEGNMMVLNGFSFTVDEACMGLNMLAISLLMGVFVLIHFFKKEQRTLSFGRLIIFFLLVFVLNMISNLFRIQMLVIFKVLPENVLHEIIGIACLLLYVMIPLYYISQWFITRWGKPMINVKATAPLSIQSRISGYAVGVLVMISGFFIQSERTEAETYHAQVSFGKVVPEELEGGITKFYDKNLLVYIKTIPEFFSGEHTPLICWKGSGYTFKKITKLKIEDQEVFYGTLVKGNALLHTAWWYTNGEMQTIDQWTWRTQMIKSNDRFCLVNVTAPDEQELQRSLRYIFRNQALQIHLSGVKIPKRNFVVSQ